MVIIALLIANLGYGRIVIRKVNKLKEAIKEIEPVVKEFSYAANKTETTVVQLKQNLAAGASNQPSGFASTASADSSDHTGRATNRESIDMQDNKELVRGFFQSTQKRRRA